MWRNSVVKEFITWLKTHNEQFEEEDQKKAGFYGMDLYSWFRSMEAVLEYLRKVSPEDAEIVSKKYGKFHEFENTKRSYGSSVEYGISPSLEKDVVEVLVHLYEKGPDYLKGIGGLIDGDELFFAQRNADLVKCAEEYYRHTYRPGSVTWNYRDAHMTDTIVALFEHFKRNNVSPKAVIWAHNSHLGDASKTDSGRKRGKWNVGQLVRKHFGLKNTFNIGFSTYKGTVTAVPQWNEPAHFRQVRNALMNSWEHLLHETSKISQDPEYCLMFRSNNPQYPVARNLRDMYSDKRLERYIGVVYRPETEKLSHYYHSNLALEYDSVIFIDETSALVPLEIPQSTWAHRKETWTRNPDPYPELDSTPLTGDKMMQERLKAAKEIELLGDQKQKEQDMSQALQLYNKALNYITYNMVEEYDNQQVLEQRESVLIKKMACNQAEERWNDVIEDCRLVLATNSKNLKALYYLCTAFMEKGRLDLAKKHAKDMEYAKSSKEYKEIQEKLEQCKKIKKQKKSFLLNFLE